MTKTESKGVEKFSSVDFNPIDAKYILNIHKYLMKVTWYEMMFGLIKKIFIGLLTALVNDPIHAKCVLLSNQKCNNQLITEINNWKAITRHISYDDNSRFNGRKYNWNK